MSDPAFWSSYVEVVMAAFSLGLAVGGLLVGLLFGGFWYIGRLLFHFSAFGNVAGSFRHSLSCEVSEEVDDGTQPPFGGENKAHNGKEPR